MSNDLYYQKLKSLIDAGRVLMHIIIAPPRTNSSLVEHVMGNSPDINNECHEPFLEARHDNFDPDHGYQQIYKSIGGEHFEQSAERTSVVVKEMSHWIGKNEEYKRLVELATGPIIVLIRNPLLSVESRIRRVLTTVDMRYSIDLQRYLLDDMATEKGFPSWTDLADAVRSGAYTERLAFLENEGGIERLYDTPILTVQNKLLDFKAHKNGYTNWRDLIERKLYTERDYNFFEGILKANVRRLDFEKDEFKKLAEEVKYFEDQKKKFVVFDTTDLRAAPDEQFREICSRTGIRFSPKMLQWSEPVDFHTEQTEQFEKLWYDTLFSSEQVNSPTEIPPVLTMFPKFVQKYLRADNLPIYAKLAKNKILKDDLRHELNEREFKVRVTNSNREQLRELGIIGENIEIGEQTSVKLKHIDPIYAVTNEPELIENPEFRRFKDVYASELKIVFDIVSDYDEHTRELKGHNNPGEIKFK